ncbi:ABC transporter permease [Paenibacillus sp. FSL K6-1230]|uniref:ABC transporter permease n=1 Tax=Paenibacillus sp. FSL K6-1230 TaxID=2921603 RepID=UPI0030F64B2F
MDLNKLLQDRRASFWKQILPYLGYVLQSGLAAVFAFIMIAFAAWYTSLLQNVPAELPIRWIMLLVLIPVAYSSYRTYLTDADIVFLRPQEYRMQVYFRSVHTRGVTYKAIGMLLLLMILWPLYVRSEVEPRELILSVVLLLLVKGLSGYGGWQELRMVSPSLRRVFAVGRWVLALLILGAWWWYPPLRSLPFIVLIAVLYLILLRLPIKHPVPWELLIAQEKSNGGRLMRVLSWFVDVPALGQQITSRSWLSWLGAGMGWNRANAYRFLLTKTFTRTEAAGIVIRLLVLGLLLVGFTASGWLGSLLYLLFLLLIGLQITSLRRSHQESLWLQLYPITSEQRKQAFLSFITRMILPIVILLWLPLLSGGMERLGMSVLTLAGGGVVLLLMRASQARRWAKAEEDE